MKRTDWGLQQCGAFLGLDSDDDSDRRDSFDGFFCRNGFTLFAQLVAPVQLQGGKLMVLTVSGSERQGPACQQAFPTVRGQPGPPAGVGPWDLISSLGMDHSLPVFCPKV